MAINVLHVIADMEPAKGGVCQAVRTMVSGLAKQGIYNEVVSLDLPTASFLADDPTIIHALGPGKGPWQYSPHLLPWLHNNLARFDKVLVHGLWLYPGFAVSKALRQLRHKITPPSIATQLFIMPHGMLDPYFQQASSRRIKAWRNWAYWKLIESRVVNESAGILFTCETERLLARQPFSPYHPQRELVIGLGVEEPAPYSSSMKQAFIARCPGLHNRPYLLFLSRLHDKKGVDLLLQAYKQVNSTLSVQLPALVIAGPGLDSEYGRYLQQLAAQLSASTVYFPGMLEGEAKWGAFYGCEAFVLPSHQENFGIAVVEALACSIPVLISNQVNIWREIAESRGGLVDDDTLAGTQRLLEKWYALSEADKRDMKVQALATYQASFAVGPVAEKTASVLQ